MTPYLIHRRKAFRPTGGGGPEIPVTSGLLAHYKADAITGLSNDDPVGTWPDSSGNGNDATQSSAGAKPLFKTNVLNSLPGVYFDSFNDYMITPMTGVGLPCTLFAVYDMVLNMGASFQNVIADTDAYYLLGQNGWNHCFYTNTTGAISDGGIVDNVAIYASLQSISGDKDYYWVNGAAVGNATQRRTPNQFHLGGSGYYPQPLGGRIFEIAIFQSALNTTDRQSVEAYLASKWGF